jgi:hypothetical protein
MVGWLRNRLIGWLEQKIMIGLLEQKLEQIDWLAAGKKE